MYLAANIYFCNIELLESKLHALQESGCFLLHYIPDPPHRMQFIRKIGYDGLDNETSYKISFTSENYSYSTRGRPCAL